MQGMVRLPGYSHGGKGGSYDEDPHKGLYAFILLVRNVCRTVDTVLLLMYSTNRLIRIWYFSIPIKSLNGKQRSSGHAILQTSIASCCFRLYSTGKLSIDSNIPRWEKGNSWHTVRSSAPYC